MRVFRGFDNLPEFRYGVATTGSFDGVHCGHRVLLDRVCEVAKREGGESIVLTFDPHPRITLGKAEGLQLLSTTDEKLHLLEAAGIDCVIIIPFTPQFSRLTPSEFIDDLLIAKVGIKALVVGYNHHFGHNKSGNYDYLSNSKRTSGLKVIEVNQHRVSENKVSSTVIRGVVAKGDMAQAENLLGHPYIIMGEKSATEEVTLDEQRYKLLPPAGEYPVVANGAKNILTITNDDRLFLNAPVAAGSDTNLIIEF